MATLPTPKTRASLTDYKVTGISAAGLGVGGRPIPGVVIELELSSADGSAVERRRINVSAPALVTRFDAICADIETRIAAAPELLAVT